MKSLNSSGIPSYRELTTRHIVAANFEEQLLRLHTGKFAAYVKVLASDYIMDVDWASEFSQSMRPMRSCILTYFTVFALARHSAYTKLFSRYTEMLVQYIKIRQ